MLKKILFSFGLLILFIQFCHADKVCGGQPDGTLLSHPTDCSKFYTCNGGIGFEFNCPPGLNFNTKTKTCDDPANVECDQTEEPEEGDMDCPPDDDPTNLIFYPSKIRCDWYYLCSSGKPFKLSCAPGYHWNQQLFQCDIPENANCQILGSSTTDASTTSSTTKTSSTTTSTTVTSTSTSPIPTPQTSSTTTESTTLSTTTSPTSSTDSPAPEATTDQNGVICPQYGTHTYPHLTRCQYFIFCRDGLSSLQKCAVAFNFDGIDHMCVPYKEARCFGSL